MKVALVDTVDASEIHVLPVATHESSGPKHDISHMNWVRPDF